MHIWLLLLLLLLVCSNFSHNEVCKDEFYIASAREPTMQNRCEGISISFSAVKLCTRCWKTKHRHYVIKKAFSPAPRLNGPNLVWILELEVLCTRILLNDLQARISGEYVANLSAMAAQQELSCSHGQVKISAATPYNDITTEKKIF